MTEAQQTSISRLMEQARDQDKLITELKAKMDEAQAFFNKNAPEFNKLVAEKARIVGLLLNELEAAFPAKPKLEVIK